MGERKLRWGIGEVDEGRGSMEVKGKRDGGVDEGG